MQALWDLLAVRWSFIAQNPQDTTAFCIRSARSSSKKLLDVDRLRIVPQSTLRLWFDSFESNIPRRLNKFQSAEAMKMWRRSCDALPEGDCMAWSRPPSATPAWLLMRRSQFAPPPGWWRSAFDRRGGWPGGTYVRSNHQQLGLKSMKNEGKHVSGPFPPAAGTARTPQDTAGARRPPRGHRCSTPGQAPGLDRIICSEAHPGTSMRRRSLGGSRGPPLPGLPPTAHQRTSTSTARVSSAVRPPPTPPS